MIKNILILSVIYAFLMTAITLTMSQKDDGCLIVIVILSLIFTFLVVRIVYKKNISGIKQENNKLNYRNLNFQHLNKISTKPFLFGLEKKIISDHEFYFDHENFYAINTNHQTAKFNLKDISEISKTSVQINNSRIWQVKINNNNEEVVFKFAHNYTIWNKNFLEFYRKIEELNPSAIQSKWSIWSM
ncbi:hypothetical protein HHL23_00205 [Chryseobacterium sp. RP-3-3]|uniref:Uncharacterized protein n=1 Tax=Chryseobacterium antibioticum TaxID=2728847 RepID=A0A7Y0FQ27_9FLAO|nr:hypothetical protein [Chryseobacterium antibioticum]NML68235.1 hypothetical protein [Chryseobacterium antibioticum]